MAWAFETHENGGQWLTHDPTGYALHLTPAERAQLKATANDGDLLRVLDEIAGAHHFNPKKGRERLRDALALSEQAGMSKTDQLAEVRKALP